MIAMMKPAMGVMAMPFCCAGSAVPTGFHER
jgi:hypothetical protein